MIKLTFAFVLLACLQTSARTYSQDKISIRLQSTELKKAFQTIERKSEYHFMYNESILANQPKVNVNLQDASITSILEILLAGTGINFKILNNNLIVLKNGNSGIKVDIQDIRVTGRVTGATGAPISGVSVTIRGTSTGTTTDNDGRYSISVPDQNSVLVFSSVGFGSQEVSVGNKTNIDVTLTAAASELENIVVVGYGTQRKLDVTGSVSQVKGEEISKQPVINPISGLQGKVAGVQITNNGAPGSSPQVRIRGVGTVYGNPNPLYVVDGVWFDDISFLNPNDIENISVLKDASSESIYGIRAANGVILITTRKGRGGQSQVSYNGYVGMQSVTNEVEMANGTEYATLVNELRVANGVAPLFSNPSTFGEGTDWYHQILRNAIIHSHQVSLSGGTEKSTYTFSLGYLNQEGIVEKNNYTRYTARLQNDIQAFRFLKVGYSITSAYSNSKDIPGGIFHELYAAAPIVPVYYADGSYGDPSDYDLGDGNNFNPQVTLDVYNQKSRNYRMTGNAFADLKFAKNFTFHTSIGGEFGQGEVRNYQGVYVATLKQRSTISTLNLSRAETRNWIAENTLTYDRRFNDHSLKVLLGQSAQRYKFYSLSGKANDVPYNTEADLFFRLGNDSTRFIDDNGDLSTISSYFTRVNYSFRNRYLLTLSLRADGSSKFTGDDRWGYFPSVGAGWVISDENFMKNQKIFNTLKLRGSWGKIGNASVPSNISTLTITQFPVAIFGGGSTGTAANVASIVPPRTFWERGVGTDIGLEANVLRNRLYFEADYYIKRTEDAIFAIPVLGSVGLNESRIVGNQATFENRGWEFLATWRDNINRSLSYSVSANVGINKNEVLDVVTGANPIYAGGAASTGGALATRTVLGQPIGQFYGYQVAGIFQTAAEVASSAQTAAKPGDFRYVDQNKDNLIDGKDRVVIGNPNPKFTYGINTNWGYKNFDLTLDFQGVAKVDVYNANLGLRFGNENFSKEFYDKRWHGAGTSNTYPSANIGGGDNYLPNSFFVEDGSYFRIRNMQLGYNLSSSMVNRWRIKGVRVYVNAQNAFNFFKYRGFSPEVGGTPTNAGIDANVYPLYATYNFGVNVNF